LVAINGLIYFSLQVFKKPIISSALINGSSSLINLHKAIIGWAE